MGQIYRFIFLLSFGGLLSSNHSLAEDGRKIFVENRCYTCHTINAEAEQIQKEMEEFAKSKGVELKETDEDGDDEKHDLSNGGNERNSEWLTKFLKSPKEYFKDEADCKKLAKKKDRKKFKGSDEELQTLVNYLASLKYGEQSKEEPKSCLKE